MDITLIRSFLEVAASGSFVDAADRLLVTQSAVSLRIKRLEEVLGQALFTRSKAGAALTPAGREFEPYAMSLLKIWEESRQQIALPEGFRQSLSIAAEYSLWPRLGFRLIDRLRTDLPDLHIRTEVGQADRLIRSLIEGTAHLALVYTPQLRPGLTVRPVMDDNLVMVASWPEPDLEALGADYAFIDWGPEFVHAHALHLPQLAGSGLVLGFGSLGADFIARRRFAAYLPARHVKDTVDAGQLFYVPNAPVFPYPLWSVWRDDMDEGLARAAREALRRVTRELEGAEDAVAETLEDLADDGEVITLGDVLAVPGEDG